MGNILWLTICAALVISMQGGFCCRESGLVRSKNSISVAIKNLIDFCITSIIYFAFGFAIMHGASAYGIIGTTGYLLGDSLDPMVLAFFLFQVTICGVASTIVSGALAERMKFGACIIVCVLVAGIIYPVFGHWVWSTNEVGSPAGWLGRLGFRDFAGSTVVHSVGGWIALSAAIIIGPRLGKYDTGKTSISGHNLPLAVLGVIALWFGWLGLNAGSSSELSPKIPLIMVNTSLSAAFGGVMAIVLSWLNGRRSDTFRAMNGVIAGLVSISACCNSANPSGAVLIGCVGSSVCFYATTLLERLKIDDVIGAFPAHTCSGVWGTLAVSIFAPVSEFDCSRWEQFQIQLLGVGVCAVFSFGTSFVVLFSINKFYRLRVSKEEEEIGLNVSEHNASTEILELLRKIRNESESDLESETGTLGELVEESHHSEASQIGVLYKQLAGTAARHKATAKIMETNEKKTRRIIDTANESYVAFDSQGEIYRWNLASEELFGWSHLEAVGAHVNEKITLYENEQPAFDELSQSAQSRKRIELVVVNREDVRIPIEVSASQTQEDGETIINVFAVDISDRREMQQKLDQAQKLESIGQLAAGIAHEINTPTQFVGDNTKFLQGAFTDLNQVLEKVDEIRVAQKNGLKLDELIASLDDIVQAIDLEYLGEEIPLAIEQSLDGVHRVATIVQAMKQFSHPGSNAQIVDLNSAIDSTVTVSRNEWKYYAEVERDFDQNLPQVSCYLNEFNQVILNIIVNAAHAIEERAVQEEQHQGRIKIQTSGSASLAEIKISDNGTGIAPEVQKKIFDPFFTTKRVGKGTGQGLSIAYNVIVEKHGGSISVESELGVGTTFTIALPISAEITDGAVV